VLTDIVGLSGRAVLKALIAGETGPDQLLSLIDRRVKAAPEQLHAALTGRITDHHRFLLRLHLRQIDTLNEAVAEIDQQVQDNLAPFRTAVRQLCSVPGIKDLSGQGIISEIGTEMTRFATAAHLVSWTGLCPRNDETAGKRRSTRLRKGSPWLKAILIQCAWSAVKKKGTYLHALFHRLRQRRGAKRPSVPWPPRC
jgi:transposase